MKTFVNILKDLFTATERNRKVPLVLHREAAAVYLVVTLLLVAAPIYVKNTHLALLSSPVSFTPKQVIALINQSRVSAGLNSLSENPKLIAAAEKKAEDMASKGYFAHISPEQKTPWEFLKSEEYKYLAAGENLALDFLSAESAHQAWMNSPTHKANILNQLYSETGVAIKQGTFENRASVFIVQFFGKPAKPKNPSPTLKPIATTKPTTTPKPTSPIEKSLPTSSPKEGSTFSKPETSPTPTHSSTVLGLTIPDKKSSTNNVWFETANLLTSQPVRIRFISFFLIGTLLFGFISLLRENLSVPPRILFQVVVLIALLSYTAGAPLKKIVTAEITPTPAYDFLLPPNAVE